MASAANESKTLRDNEKFTTDNYILRPSVSWGSLSQHDVDGYENVIWKCNFAFLKSFLNYSEVLRMQNVF